MRVITGTAARTAWLALALVLLLAGDAVRFTTGWWTFSILALLVGAYAVLLLVSQRDRWRIGTLPYPLLAFLALATLSIAWSFYPAATALGLFATWVIAVTALACAIAFTWADLLAVLATVLRGILGLSLLFELFVSVVMRGPILPLFTQPGVDYSIYDKLPQMLYWSRNELFEVFDEGRIQGIVGNANNLGMLALIGLIVFVLQFADRSFGRRWSAGWIVMAVVTLVFTRSATVTVTIVVVAALAAAALLVRRARSGRARAITWTAIAGVVVAGVIGVIGFSGSILSLLGKSPDLTGRFGIWEEVIDLAQQRPVAGWGWVSFWMPWAPPFDDLAFRNGVRQLQAHDSWLDIWFQLGVLGLIVFGALILSTFARTASFALDRPQSAPGEPARFTALSLFPLLLLAALLMQSIAESRLLVEYGLFFVVVIAVKTKRESTTPA